MLTPEHDSRLISADGPERPVRVGSRESPPPAQTRVIRASQARAESSPNEWPGTSSK
jgi:hypothetical protein